MFNTWLTLRQAEEALTTGRLEEALRLVESPPLAGHKRQAELRQRICEGLLRQAELHERHGDLAASWKALEAAEALGIQAAELPAFRRRMIERQLAEANAILDRGDPDAAMAIVDGLAARAPGSVEVGRLLEAARNWALARELGSRGEWSAAAAAALKAAQAAQREWLPLAEFRRDIERLRREFERLGGELHEALEQKRHRQVIALADQMLALSPGYTVARKARERAWHAVQPPTITVARDPAPPSPSPNEELPRRLLLWIDGVGGYLICFSSRVSIGQATPDAVVDVPIMADISRLHGYLTRDAEGYLLEAARPITVNQKPAERRLLKDGDRLGLGGGCELIFRQPVPLSATARLQTTARHRLPLALDGVLLMAENCLLAQAGEAHIVIPELRRNVVLHRQGNGITLHAAGSFTVDGQPARHRAALTASSTAAAEDFRLTLEPVGPRFGK